MKYILMLLLFVAPLAAQEPLNNIVIDKQNGSVVILRQHKTIYRDEKALFYFTLYTNDDNYDNFSGIVRCTDYSFIIPIAEGKEEGKEYVTTFMSDIKSAPAENSSVLKLLKTVCNNKVTTLKGQPAQK